MAAIKSVCIRMLVSPGLVGALTMPIGLARWALIRRNPSGESGKICVRDLQGRVKTCGTGMELRTIV